VLEDPPALTGAGSLAVLGLSKSSVSDMCPSPLDSAKDDRRSDHGDEGGAEGPLTSELAAAGLMKLEQRRSRGDLSPKYDGVGYP
jgi:hypothetical protein